MRKDKKGMAFLYFMAIVLSVLVFASILAASIYRIYLVENTPEAVGKDNWKNISSRYNILVNTARFCLSQVTSGPLTQDNIQLYTNNLNTYYQLVTGKEFGQINCQIKGTHETKTKTINLGTLKYINLKYSKLTVEISIDDKTYTVVYTSDVNLGNSPLSQGSMGATDIRLDIDYEDRIAIYWSEGNVKHEYKVVAPIKIVHGYAVFKEGSEKLNLIVKPINYEYLWEISSPLILSTDLKKITIQIISPAGIHNTITVGSGANPPGGGEG